MKRHYPKTRTESAESQRAAGRWHPSKEVHWKGSWYTLGCGTSDCVSCFTAGGSLYCLTTNYRLGYAGLEEFREGDTREVFVQSEDELRELVGPKGLDYAEATLAKRLASYLDY